MKFMLRHLTRVLLIVGAMLLAGCGGGDEVTAESWVRPNFYNLISSESYMDVGISGDGWFVLQSKDSGQRSYSRFGRLGLDNEGQLIHAGGALVLGRMSESELEAKPISKAPLTMQGRATTRIGIQGNLDSRVSMASDPFDPSKPVSYSSSTAMEVHSPASGSLTLYFSKVGDATSEDRWRVHASIDGRVIDARLLLHFKPWGGPDPAMPKILRLAVGDVAQPQLIEVDLSAMTQYGSSFSVTDLQQDGYAPGALIAVVAEGDGRLTRHYSNGQTTFGGRLVLARFTVADRLVRLGESSWLCGRECAAPMIGAPGSALLGLLMPGTLNEVY